MDITQFVSEKREALLIGDYSSYRASLSRQLLALRRRVGRATNKREKFAVKPVTAEDIGSNHDFVHLLLLTSERAWAHGMQIKTTQSEDNTRVTGTTRTHILARLHKASKVASQLLESLKSRSASKANEQDLLEARAYAASLVGSEEFEKQSEGQRSADEQGNEHRWQPCLRSYSVARVIYAALLESRKKDVYRDILANTVDPTIRYAAYQAHLSRTIPIPTVAKRYFPRDDGELVKAVETLDQNALKDKPAPETQDGNQTSAQEVPNSVSWRGRKANIVDASIGQALANVSTGEARLRAYLAANSNALPREKAVAYDDVLSASQDAADAAKSATDELEKERVDEGDPRVQDLRVTSLSVNYDLVSWRVGRNRMLIGPDDGLILERQQQKISKRLRKDGTEHADRDEPRGHKLARLRERIVLYDASIQSINSIKDVRGAVRDAKFVTELDSKVSYFRALKCLNISYSHSLLGNHLNALALLKRAQDLAMQTLSISTSTPRSSSSGSPPILDIEAAAVKKLKAHVDSLTSRMHAIVEMRSLESNSAIAAAKNMVSAAPLVQRLNDYPSPGTQVDLHNLVTYPPRIEPVPVKPLFLDVAFNYIEYPGRAQQDEPVGQRPLVNGTEHAVESAPQAEKKKGWFSFGR